MSLYLFALVMDKITWDILRETFWCMLFVDDVVLVDKSRAGAGTNLGGLSGLADTDKICKSFSKTLLKLNKYSIM